MTTSKNQRSGPKVVPRMRACAKGHPLTWVNYAARGRKNMQALCECDGFRPIDKTSK